MLIKCLVEAMFLFLQQLHQNCDIARQILFRLRLMHEKASLNYSWSFVLAQNFFQFASINGREVEEVTV